MNKQTDCTMMSSACAEALPLISVIVPVYNTAPWLARCLDSICAQTYRNLEILCVNDGSTDNSAEILAEYAAKDARIKVFTQANAGLSAARNTALEHATGEWVTGVDSDDYLVPGVYERAVACISPAVDMVFFGVQNVTEDGTWMPHGEYFRLPPRGQEKMTPKLAEKLNVCFWSKLWRRSLLEQYKLRFPHGLVHEDEALYYLYAPLVRELAVCPEIGYYYVQRPASIMHSSITFQERVHRMLKVMDYVLQGFGNRGEDAAVSPYIMVMQSRLYTSLYHHASEKERPWLQRAFYRVLKPSGIFRNWRDDYRLERVRPVAWWQRPFMQRYLNCALHRFFMVPLWVQHYDGNGNRTRREDILWGKLKKIWKGVR